MSNIVSTLETGIIKFLYICLDSLDKIDAVHGEPTDRSVLIRRKIEGALDVLENE